MQKESLINLINKLERNNIKKVEELLKKDEEVLKLLGLLGNSVFKEGVEIALADYKSIEDITTALSILVNTNPEKRLMISKILSNNRLIEKDLAINCAKIINDELFNTAKAYHYLKQPSTINRDNNTIFKDLRLIIKSNTSTNADYVAKLLIYQEKYPTTILTEGIKILQEASDPKKIKYMYNVLINKESIKYGIAIEGAKLIDTLKPHTASYAEYILTSEYIIKKGIAIDLVKILNDYDTEEHCMDAMDLIENDNILEGNVTLESIELIKKSNREIHAPYLYNVLINNKLIKANLSVAVGEKVISATEEYDAEYISNLVCCHDVNPNIILEGCDLLVKIKDNKLKVLVFHVLTNKYLNENNNALVCAKQIINIKDYEKTEFITRIVLKDKDFASDKYITEIIEEIKTSNSSFTSFNIKLSTKYARIVEFGVMYINRSINTNIFQLEYLMNNMKKLTDEEIEVFISKFNNFFYRIKLIQKMSDKKTGIPQIINLLKETTNTKEFDHNSTNEFEVSVIDKSTENKNSDTQILLELIKEEQSQDIKTDVLVKKLIKRRENNTKGNTTE